MLAHKWGYMEKKFIIDTEENKEYLGALAKELLEFGKRFPSEKGGSYYLGDDGTPWVDRPRETWITSRMVHVYSMGSMMGMEEAFGLAGKGLDGLRSELKDITNGGWYAGVDADGNPLSGKACYAHAFVILASSSAMLAGVSGAKELLDEALSVYDKWFWDEELGLSVDNWNTDFTVLDTYRGINANMHTVEAFLAVADATGDDKYRERAGRIIERVVNWAANNNWRIPEHFTDSWDADLECNSDKKDDQFKPYGATPGHGIEWARLITQWAVSTYDGELMQDKYIDAAVKLYNRAISDAWNADGHRGICYTTDWNGVPVVHDRMHWTLAEAINTSAVLYRVTGDTKYADDFAGYLQYLDERVHDKVNGSWFHQLDRENNVIGTVWPGKSDVYHALQSMLIPYLNVGVSVATNIYNKRK